MSSASESLQLLRIEHKLDILLRGLKYGGILISDLPDLGEYDGDICPVCESIIRVGIDVMSETYTRTCACRPPTPIVPGISGVMNPAPTTERDPNVRTEPSDAPGEG